MRVLIVTQAVDENDPILGFFCRWLTEFAKHFETIEVICLSEGSHALPPNVRVHSLGKEHASIYGSMLRRAAYAARFKWMAWKLRHEYDAVFVHMNQEYVLLAGWLWRIFGKRIYLWRNHYAGSFLTTIAAAFCTAVFCTSRASYTARYRNTLLMPVGIDMDIFRPVQGASRVPRSILSLGRIAPPKNIHLAVEAFGILSARGIDFIADIYGDVLPKDEDYARALHARVKALGLSQRVRFHAGIRNQDTPRIYSVADLFVNLSPAGMFDKTLLEAAACGCRVLSASPDFARESGEPPVSLDAASIAERMEQLLSGSSRRSSADMLAHHSLKALGNALAGVMAGHSESVGI